MQSQRYTYVCKRRHGHPVILQSVQYMDWTLTNILRVLSIWYSCSTASSQLLHQGCGRVLQQHRCDLLSLTTVLVGRHVSDKPLRCLLLSVINKQHTHNHTLLQHVSIACYAERCISYSKSVRPSVCLSHAGTVSIRLKLQQWGLHWRIAPWL